MGGQARLNAKPGHERVMQAAGGESMPDLEAGFVFIKGFGDDQKATTMTKIRHLLENSRPGSHIQAKANR